MDSRSSDPRWTTVINVINLQCLESVRSSLSMLFTLLYWTATEWIGQQLTSWQSLDEHDFMQLLFVGTEPTPPLELKRTYTFLIKNQDIWTLLHCILRPSDMRSVQPDFDRYPHARDVPTLVNAESDGPWSISFIGYIRIQLLNFLNHIYSSCISPTVDPSPTTRGALIGVWRAAHLLGLPPCSEAQLEFCTIEAT